MEELQLEALASTAILEQNSAKSVQETCRDAVIAAAIHEAVAGDGEVDLCRQNFSDVSRVSILCDYLVDSSSRILELDLSGGTLTPMGAVALCKALSHCKYLTDLDLFSCGVGDDGAIAIAESLPTWVRLRRLDLWKNQITDIGLKALGLAVTRTYALEEFVLSGNAVSRVGLEEFAFILAEEPPRKLMGFGSAPFITLHEFAPALNLPQDMTAHQASNEDILEWLRWQYSSAQPKSVWEVLEFS